MIYSELSTITLKEFHASIKECLNKDDLTLKGQMKPYGVREFEDWGELIAIIETTLTKRQEPYTPILLSPNKIKNNPIPVEFILYERIKSCLAFDDSLSSLADKPYGVRDFPDWKIQANSLEKSLDHFKYTYSRIVW